MSESLATLGREIEAFTGLRTYRGLMPAPKLNVPSIRGRIMADPQVLTAIRRKQAEIENVIAA
jgi:hypothetical protein